jgi:hypothetical protein
MIVINVRDEINKATVGLEKAIESLLDAIDELEPYQRYELLHPQKKPRGSIRRRMMNKVMTVDEAIELLKDKRFEINCKVNGTTQFSKALEMAIEALEQTEWIPVSEKMPPIAQRVLVSATNGEVLIARYHSFDKWTFEPTGISYAYNKDSVVAWMPLPQPYKAESGV